MGCKAGISINPETSISGFKILDHLDLILVMSVNPGFGGQKFIPSSIEKLENLKLLVGERPIHIQVDGGVDHEVAQNLYKQGHVLVAGSTSLKENLSDYKNNISLLRNSLINEQTNF